MKSLNSMKTSALINPFSEKYLLPGAVRSRVQGWQGRLPYYLDLSENLSWHYKWNICNVPASFNELVAELSALRDKPLPAIVGSPRKPRKGQPTWNPSDPTSKSVPYRGDEDEERKDEGEGADSGNMNGSKQGDKKKRSICRYLAYYVPAHLQLPDSYGVHLIKRGIAHLRYDVQSYCKEKTSLNAKNIEVPRTLALASTLVLLGHEYIHSYVEDLCCLIDFSEGTTTLPVTDRKYMRARKRYGVILMEECLCNTAALGWLCEFFKSPNPTSEAFGGRQFAKYTQAFYDWMKDSPAGYSWVDRHSQEPSRSENFFLNIRRLLIEIYGYDQHSVPDATTLMKYFPPGFAMFRGSHVPLLLER